MLLGLKTKISATLLILLFIGMLLVNVVVVFFWQRSLVLAEINHTEAVVNLWYKKSVFLSSDQMSSPKSLMEVCLAIGASCKNVGFFDGEKEYSIHKGAKFDLSALLRRGHTEKKPIRQTAGQIWKMFIFGGKYLYQVLPLKSDNRDRYTIALAIDLESIYEKISEKQPLIFYYIAINAIVLATIGFFRLAKYFLRPIDKLISLSESYTNADGMIFSSYQADNEFGKLSFALNSMLGRINEDKHKLQKNVQSLEQANKQLVDSQKKMVHVEKMAAVGKLSAGLAHEVGNPIGIVQGYLELLENDDLTVEERRQFSGRAVKELERVNKMVRQLLDFSRTSSEDNAFVSVGQVCKDAGVVLKSQKVSSGIEFTIDIYDGEDTAGIGYDNLYQVLLNCSFNAIDAIQERGIGFAGQISIFSSLSESNSILPYIEIQIIDNGIGIPEKDLTSVFDPFFTTKDVGKGTGLGLSISYGIIEAAGGNMEIESVYGNGTKVMISLPLVHLSEESKIAKQLIAHG